MNSPMPRAKATGTKTRSSGSSLLRKQTDGLALEAFSIICDALTYSGMPLARQRRIFAQAAKKGHPPEAMSETILQEFRDLGDMLTAWLQDLPYADAAGRPKVLPIRGKKASFESLARQYLPTRHLKDAVAFACKNANVIVQKGDRILFQGDPVVKLADDPAAALAQIVSHVKNIVRTVELNRKRKSAQTRLLERVVAYPLDPAQFEIFREFLRLPLNELTEHAEHIAKSVANGSLKRRGKTYTAGLGVYLYFREPEPRASRSRRAVKRKSRTR